MKFNLGKVNITKWEKICIIYNISCAILGFTRSLRTEKSKKILYSYRILYALMNGILYAIPYYNITVIIQILNRIQLSTWDDSFKHENRNEYAEYFPYDICKSIL